MGNQHEENDSQTEKKPLTLLKGAVGKRQLGTSQVRQSFSHGRSKTVTVEVKKKRSLLGTKDNAPESPREDAGGVFSRLTTSEQDTRFKAFKEAMQVAAEEAVLAEKKEKEAQETTAAPKDPVSEIAETAGDVGAPDLAAPEAEDKGARKKFASTRPGHGHHIPHKVIRDEEDEEEIPARKKQGPAVPRRVEPVLRKEDVRRNLGKILLKEDGDEDESNKRRKSEEVFPGSRLKPKKKTRVSSPLPPQKIIRDVIIPEYITVQELANRMSERAGDVIKTLINMGVMVTVTQTIDADTAELVVTELGHSGTRIRESDIELGLMGGEDTPSDLVPRAPVVTIMGHVDHGKTSLLDALRKTNVVSGEAGGITQHIGAYQVSLPSGQRITFIDTPGHAAFTEMRSRGAHVTDIVVLVVAADDGVKDQTIEAIHHARAAKVSLIVAINKIDKPDSNPNHVRQMLLQHEIVLEEMGGDVLDVEVSAKTGLNLDKLEETILLQAEVLDLKANPNRFAEGVVIEAKLEKGRGAVATVLVQRGTLKVGDIFVSGSESGRVRALIDDCGHKVQTAGPSVPVEILGFNAPPAAGDDFIVVESEARAREVAEFRLKRMKDARNAQFLKNNTIEQLLSRKMEEGQVQELPLILKTDVQGSLEALIGGLEKLSTSEVKVRILHGAVGAITESDMTLAKASKAFVIGFNVRANPQARDIARREGIELRYYSVIYNALDEVKAAMSGLLSPTLREKFLGNAEIRKVFNITKVGKVAGCMVVEGAVRRGSKVRLLRDLVVIHEGTLKTLKRMKDEVKEVKEGYECGMAFENYHDIREGDVIECFDIEEIQRTL